METFNNKTAFITGGASGIGLGIAKAFLNSGANVAIVISIKNSFQLRKKNLKQ